MKSSMTEHMVIADFEAKGFKVLKNGAPDLLIYKEQAGKISDASFIEVKSPTDQLKPQQRKYLEVLRALGFKADVLRVDSKPDGDPMLAYEKRILSLLTEIGRSSASRVAGFAGLSVVQTRAILKKLVKEKRIIKEEETLATYWRLKA